MVVLITSIAPNFHEERGRVPENSFTRYVAYDMLSAVGEEGGGGASPSIGELKLWDGSAMFNL